MCLPAVAIDKDTGLSKIAGGELFMIIEGCPVMYCSKIVEEHSGRKPDIRVEIVELQTVNVEVSHRSFLLEIPGIRVIIPAFTSPDEVSAARLRGVRPRGVGRKERTRWP